MKLFNKQAKTKPSTDGSGTVTPTPPSNNAAAAAATATPPMKPMPMLLHTPDNHAFVTVREPWTWIMNTICDTVNQQPHETHMTLLDGGFPDLPSGKMWLSSSLSSSSSSSMAATSPPNNEGRPAALSSSSRRATSTARRTKPSSALQAMNTLRIDVVTNHSSYVLDEEQQQQSPSNTNTTKRAWTLHSFHGTSEAFDGLDDKDEFVRTMQRCRCDHLELSPPSVLINWDASAQECKNLVGESMPALLGNEAATAAAGTATVTDTTIGVLKEPMGKSGAGVFFVHNADEIHALMDRNRKLAVEEPGRLDALIAEKGRIPSWVLQAEVKPCLLIRDRRKFHIRTHVVCIENVILDSNEGDQDDDDDFMKLFIYDKHEIRIANSSVPEEDTPDRDRSVHIMDAHAERKLMRDEPELVERNISEKCQLFAAQIFDKHVRSDIERRIALSAAAMEEEIEASGGTMVHPHKFVVAGLDLMVTEDERIYLLEVNVNPSAPDPETVSSDFQNYLLNFQKDLMELVTTKGASAKQPNSCFISTGSILERKL